MATPRPASSVLLFDAARPWRLLLMRRPDTAGFAPGVWVFPGGGVHQADAALPDPVRAAAVREVFEEVGILLGRTAQGRIAGPDDAARIRAALDGGAGFWDAVTAAELVPALDDLAFCGRWITPRQVRRRYDTRFYLIPHPPGQTVDPEPGEVVEWRWMTPAEALADDTMEMIHVTQRILEQVRPHRDPHALHAQLRVRPETPAITPRLERRPDGTAAIVDEIGE